jgi:hypothetical protein
MVKDRVAPGTLFVLSSDERCVDGLVNRETPDESRDLENLFDQAIHAAYPEGSAFALERLADRDERTEPHAADVSQFAQIDDQDGQSSGDTSVAVLLKLRSILGVHAAGHKKHSVV